MLVAEVGQNHCGDMSLAKDLIGLASENGADMVKFQLYDSLVLYGEKQKTELTKDQAFELFEYGQSLDIPVFFSVFDKERVRWCREMGVSAIKIAASKARDYELVEYAAQGDMPIIISIYGMPYKLPEWLKFYKWLYCVPHYPTELTELHFNQMNGFDGFSDHTIGLTAAKIALARGVQMIEKHFAIDYKTGVDARWSMIPAELAELKGFAKNVSEVL